MPWCTWGVWYKLHTTSDARNWPNILLVCELLFSLPFTNSKVERTFSAMKIKTDRRTALTSDTLDDLMGINIEGPSLSGFSADHAVQLWWADHTRRPNQRPRKEYRKRVVEAETTDNTEAETIWNVSHSLGQLVHRHGIRLILFCKFFFIPHAFHALGTCHKKGTYTTTRYLWFLCLHYGLYHGTRWSIDCMQLYYTLYNDQIILYRNGPEHTGIVPTMLQWIPIMEQNL